MKLNTMVKWMAVWFLSTSLTAHAQGLAGGTNGATGGSGQGSPGVHHQRPSPEQMAAHLMEKFDANKDGELSQAELTQALEAMRAHHPRGAGSGEPGGTSSNAVGRAALGGQGGQHPEPPPADKVAAQMIAKFAADGKGLTQAELVKALAARQANHGPQGGGQKGGEPANVPNPGSI